MIPDKVTDITGLSNELLEHQARFSYNSGLLLKLFLENLPQPLCLIAHNGNRYDFPLLKAELLNRDFDLDIYTADSLTILKEIFNRPKKSISNEIEELMLYESFEDDFEHDLNQVKKPCLRDGDELNLYKTPEKSPKFDPLTPPPTDHSLTRKKMSELMSPDRRKNGAKVKKQLEFDKPTSFSLPLLHQHIFGRKPKNSHGAGVDVDALIRVCATNGENFMNYLNDNYGQFQNVKKMW